MPTDTMMKEAMKARWLIDDIHPLYGKVLACGCKDGEPWRMFSIEGTTTLIPLDSLGQA